MSETAAILEKLERIEQTQQKSWLASLTEKSAVLLNTEQIAELCGRSYDYTYKHIVADPDFPRPSAIGTGGKRGKSSRRWVAGEVIRYIKSQS